MKKPSDIVQKVSASEPYKSLLGATSEASDPVTTKRAIVEVLAPFFDDHSILERFALEFLLPEAIGLALLSQSAGYSEWFSGVVQGYREAKHRDPVSFYHALEFWNRPCELALVKYWNVYNLEVEKDDLPLDEYVHESFRNIGDIVEGLTQPFLRAYLNITRIRTGATTNSDEIQALDLGIVIDQLITYSDSSDLFFIPPWNIRLNQCRNIAFHHSSEIKGAQIVCSYGKSPNIKTFSTTREELFQATRNVFNVFRVLKIAYSLVFVDNISNLTIAASDLPEVRREAQLANLTLQFASQGFDVISFSHSSELATFRVRDTLKRNDAIRAAHSSQFLMYVWHATKSRMVAVEYENADGKLCSRSSLDCESCEQISKQPKEPLQLQAKLMKFELLV